MVPNLHGKIEHESLGTLTYTIGIGEKSTSICINPGIKKAVIDAYKKSFDIMDAISALYMKYMGKDKECDIIGYFFEIADQFNGPEDLITKFTQLYENIYVKKIMLANDVEEYLKKIEQANEDPYTPSMADSSANTNNELQAGNTIQCSIKLSNGKEIHSSQTEVKEKSGELYAYLDHLSTDMGYRGKGIATIGISKLEKFLQVNDITRLTLEVGEIDGVNRYDLVNFYKKRGFESAGNGKFVKYISPNPDDEDIPNFYF